MALRYIAMDKVINKDKGGPTLLKLTNVKIYFAILILFFERTRLKVSSFMPK